MIVSLITAIGKNNVLGKDNKLLWHLPKEFMHFQKTTMGHHLIMGRKTFESLPAPLPGRPIITVTRQQYSKEGCLVVHSVEEALKLAKSREEKEVFICGGAEIYKEFLQKDLVDKMYLTMVDFNGEGDAYFPSFNKADWKELQIEYFPADEKNIYPWKLYTYLRNRVHKDT